MDEPPFIIDGARVLAHAALPSAGTAPAHAVAGGIPVEGAAGVAVVESLAEGATFLLYCDAEWATLGAEQHGDAASAQRTVQASFPALEWKPFRALSESEEAQLRTTREFLRDLARDFPGGT